MSGRGKPARRRKRESPTSQKGAKKNKKEETGENEENVVLLEGHGSSAGKIIDFEQIINESLATDVQQNDQKGLDTCINDRPQLIRCGGDSLGMLTPENLQTKIKQNEYVNLALLLKGTVDAKEAQQETLLGIDERGNIVTKPRQSNEKIVSIEQWTDAFLIYSSIYLSAHPEQSQDMLQYMFVIREAARKHGGFQWRTYDEQFRLRQSSLFMPWSKINADLWLRCFSGSYRPPMKTDLSMQTKTPPPCIDFNKGYCQFKNCRFPHICSTCSSPQHGRWRCHVNGPNVNAASTFRGSFKPAQRGWPRGAASGKRF